MTWIDVPSLAVERIAQRYELRRPGLLRYSDSSFAGELGLDDDGFVVRYPGLAERVHPPLRDNRP
ncbi:MAG: putative glycolipid-binding domain-containing protein [Actinobacteria bacterium]|nr:putative glycolipid-binding domain-containing protein [Actinomycetota bacterium]